MRVTRVHAPGPLATGAVLPLPEGAARHVARVLRLGEGDALCMFDGSGGEFEARVEQVRRDAVTVRIGAHRPVERESPLHITLLQGIARGEKMDLILQKATELGAAAFVPVSMARSTVRLDARTSATRQQHWQAVVTSACEQCGRNRLPAVAAAQSLPQALAATSGPGLLLVADEGAASLEQALSAAGTTSRVRLLVGPEGGFDPAEIDTAAAAGLRPCRLGPRVLRTETAGLAALAALQFLAGDLR
jgi:16S rRNA (uracil1498-N3)-methyltransferase